MSKTFTQFRVDNVVTTLPTTLDYGKEVYYKDSNGNLTLWVGHEDGTAWPAVGYKEYVAILTQSGTNAPVANVVSNTLGLDVVYTRIGVGSYVGTHQEIDSTRTIYLHNSIGSPMGVVSTFQRLNSTSFEIIIFNPLTTVDFAGEEVVYAPTGEDNTLSNAFCAVIRVYP